jgi:putative ABC transport system permease protein
MSMLTYRPLRTVLTISGIAAAVFLSMAQIGLMVGWCNTTSGIIRHSNVDIWIMSKQTPALDYGTGIARQTIYKARTCPGVAWAEGMFMGWNYWQRPDGGRVNIELIGLDEACAGGPWKMQRGRVSVVQLPDTVIVDELFLGQLGVREIGDEIEILGRRARIGGISEGIRTMTAAPFVFTSLETAKKYDRRSSFDDVTYVLVRCKPNQDPARVCELIMKDIRGVEALTTWNFAVRTMRYWMLETGIGITVVLTAILGLAVGAVIISQTLYATTNEHIGDYAVLLAIGFPRRRLLALVGMQAAILGTIGTILGIAMLFAAMRASARTPIPIESTPGILAAQALLSVLICLLASSLAMRTVLRVDPVTVFRG